MHNELLKTLEIKPNLQKLGQINLLNIMAQSWQQLAMTAAELKYRFVALWAQDLAPKQHFEINFVLELKGSYLLLRTLIDYTEPFIASVTPYFLAANRLERHTHDMFGINFVGHPDPRRWTRHLAWSREQFPLRKSFDIKTLPNSITKPDNQYPFNELKNPENYEIPVGPIHAGIIEPGHFRFQVDGEDVVNLEEHLGYTHKGIEKLVEGQGIEKLIKIAGRVSGDSTVAYTWATCDALEKAVNLAVPARGTYIRALMSEHERIANHLGDIAGICNDVSYAFGFYQLMRLKELWLRLNHKVFGHRLIMDCIIPGGVNIGLNEQNYVDILKQVDMLNNELKNLYELFINNAGFIDRVKNTGVLSIQQALSLGVLGYAGRASGQKFDVRINAPYAPYDQLKISMPTFNTGDVLARLQVRKQEILISLDLIKQLIAQLKQTSNNKIAASWSASNITSNTIIEGIGLIEGWRGEVLAFVRINNYGVVERYFLRDPSWFSWLALEELIHGNIVPDFPVCNKSINGSYSGVDL